MRSKSRTKGVLQELNFPAATGQPHHLRQTLDPDWGRDPRTQVTTPPAVMSLSQYKTPGETKTHSLTPGTFISSHVDFVPSTPLPQRGGGQGLHKAFPLATKPTTALRITFSFVQPNILGSTQRTQRAPFHPATELSLIS